MKNNIIRGVRKASDFLMALQLTGAFKEEALANLQARAPGGRHRRRSRPRSTRRRSSWPTTRSRPRRRWRATRRSAPRRARTRSGPRSTPRSGTSSIACSPTAWPSTRSASGPHAAGEIPDLARLCREWGGVAIAYRRDAGRVPRLPAEPRGDHQGARGGHLVHRGTRAARSGARRARQARSHALPARAARARPWSCRRGPASSRRERRPTSPTRRSIRTRSRSTRSDASSRPTSAVRSGTAAGVSSRRTPTTRARSSRAIVAGGKFVTFFGDNHPAYNGNVVKAMASARNGYRRDRRASSTARPSRRRVPGCRVGRVRAAACEDDLTARVVAVNRLTPTIVEVVVQRAGGRAQLPAGPVLPAPEPRVARAPARRARPS